MLGNIFAGFRILHFILAVLAAIGFFMFWKRTRFWLPKYVHVIALIALLVGFWFDSTLSRDAPIKSAGPIGHALLILLFPAIVYFFFVFYGGQRAAFVRRSKSATEIAELIERFVSGNSLYSQEWHDFVSHTQPDKVLESYRKRCAGLDPLLEGPESPDAKAMEDLRRMAQELRSLSVLG